MSVTFYIAGEEIDFEADWPRDDDPSPKFLNLANANAVDLLRWLGYETDGRDLYGALLPGDLRARCQRRLAPTPKNVSDDLPRAYVERHNAAGGRVIQCERQMGYLREKTTKLLAIAERAGDRPIVFD